MNEKLKELNMRRMRNSLAEKLFIARVIKWGHAGDFCERDFIDKQADTCFKEADSFIKCLNKHNGQSCGE